MADPSTLAHPYAKAVFELARDGGRLKPWSAQLAMIAAAVADPQLRRLIGNPAVGKTDLADIFGKMLASQLDGEGKALLRLLIENGRLWVAPAIAALFEWLRADAESRVDVEITSAAAVDAAQQDALAGAIKRRLKRDVAVRWNTDDALIAGAVIRAGDLVIDGSVRGELQRLHTVLTH